ncbi:MAG: DMT family transporter [Synechococcales bacterium]|nr:DMT family transporter [Synechococcales bacterium]
MIAQPPRWKLYGVLALGTIAISTAAILIRLAMQSAEAQGIGFSLVLAAVRLSLAALSLWVYGLSWKGISLHRSPSSPPTLVPSFPKPPQTAFLYAIVAGLCLAAHFAAWITSLSYTSIAASTTLVTTSPIWVALLSRFCFQERLRGQTWFGILLALLGGLLISHEPQTSAGAQPWLGNGLALLGAWAATAYLLCGQQAQKWGLGLQSYVTIVYTMAALLLLPLPWLLGRSYSGYPPSTYLWMGAMALIPQLVGHTSFNWAVRYLSPTIVTLVILLEPIGASLLAYLVFRELPTYPLILGAMIVLVGVAIAVTASNNSIQQSSPPSES